MVTDDYLMPGRRDMIPSLHRCLRLAPGRPTGTRDNDRRHCQPPNLSGLEPPAQLCLVGLEPRPQVALETDAALDLWGDLFCKHQVREQFNITFGYFMALAVEARRHYLRAALRARKP